MFTDPIFGREMRAEADSNRGPSAYLPNASPLSQTGSRYHSISDHRIYRGRSMVITVCADKVFHPDITVLAG